MKYKAFIKQYNLNEKEFTQFLLSPAAKEFKIYVTESEWVDGFSKIDDSVNAADLIACFTRYKEGIAAQEQAKMQAERDKKQALSNMLISSGFSFEGHSIVKYSGYISGDDVCEIPRGGIFGNNNGQNLTDALVKIRRKALQELKEAAYDLGCNAIIGVDFDYITLEPESVNLAGGTRYEPYIICVTANGNAVVIEKDV